MGCQAISYHDLLKISCDFQRQTAELKQENNKLERDLSYKSKTIHHLQEQLSMLRNSKYGKKTESLSAIMPLLPIFDDIDDPMVSEEAVDDNEAVTYTRKKRKKKNGRNIDTSKLPREVVIHDLSEEEKTCDCGQCLIKIGEDRSECLEIIPAVIKVVEHVRIKYACRPCQSIKMGPKPEKALAKSMAGDSLIVDVIIKKYAHHLPLFRQSKILSKLDINIPYNTMGNWVMSAAEILHPLGEALSDELSNVRLLQADETPVKVLKPEKKGYMWAYQSLDPGNKFIFFEFSLGRGGDVPKNRLKGFSGIMQTDGYSGYNHFRDTQGIVSLGCWDHARRKFVDAIKIANNNKNGLAGKFVKLIAKLYNIEREHKQSKNEERYAARQKESIPILNELFELAKDSRALPKSSLGKAITYLHNNEPDLREYCNYGDTQISNCLTENQIRPFAIGRKNWMFVGTPKSANKSALLYSLIQSCDINGIDARKYLIYVLKNIHKVRRGEISARSILPQFVDKSAI